jgi:acetyl-CoA C-acetyltransferase
MRDVYVAGIGITTFTRLEYPLSEIAAYPAMMALKESGITDVDHVYVANMGSARVNHQTALASAVVDSLSLTPAGAAVVENGPASGASAIKAGFAAVASGMHDVVLVSGAERMREVNNLEATDFIATLTHPLAEYIYGVTLPSHAAMFTRLYMEKYGLTERHLAMVAVKNQNAAMLNEFAHLHQPITIEGILDSPEAMTNNPYVAEPLRFFDACPVSDGGAAVILVSEDVAQTIDRPLIRLAGVGQATMPFTSGRNQPTCWPCAGRPRSRSKWPGRPHRTWTWRNCTMLSRFWRSWRVKRWGSSRKGKGTSLLRKEKRLWPVPSRSTPPAV